MKRIIGEKLKELRLVRGLTQKELASRIKGGMDYTYIGKIERGEQLPSLKVLQRISEALEVDISGFFSSELQGNRPQKVKSITPATNELQKAISRLNDEDMLLVLEIAHLLNRRRKKQSDSGSLFGEGEFSLAAETAPPYEGKDS